MLSSMLVHSTQPGSVVGSCPIHIVSAEAYMNLVPDLSKTAQSYLKATGFTHEKGKTILLAGQSGKLEAVILCAGSGAEQDPFLAGKLPALLPEGMFHFADPLPEGKTGLEPTTLVHATLFYATLAFLLGAYQFDRYTKKPDIACKLIVSGTLDANRMGILADSVAFGRDLINTPTSDLGPEAFAEAAIKLAKDYGCTPNVTIGDDLLEHNFPMIHAVGRAAAEAPRLVDFKWGKEEHPKVTLVGKSVCFDTGGLNLKPDASMLLMKKDMGGGAIALAAARMIMALDVPVRLRVILPIVENSVSSNSFRPGDVLKSRKGLTVEIGNTDAEGRLILADALALACEETPDLLLDFATLTGAARVALGPELPPYFTDDEALAKDVADAALKAQDPVWRMPLWNGYNSMLASKIADVNHISGGAFAGSVTAALFLRRFISPGTSWCHFDTYAWSQGNRPAHPDGGEVQVARLVLALLERRYGPGKNS